MTPLVELLLKATLLLAIPLLVALALPARLPVLRHRVLAMGLLLVGALPLSLLLPRWSIGIAKVSSPAPVARRDPVVSSSLPRVLEPEPTPFPWSVLGVGFYGLGAAGLLLRFGQDQWALRRLLHRAQPSAVSGPFPVLLAPQGTIPLACGVWQRRIILPVAAEHWDFERLSVVVQHESAHLRRHDPLWQLLAALLCVLWWFHPLSWLLAHRLRAEAEAACDRLVLDSGIAPERYAHHLLEVAVMLKNQTRLVAPAMARTAKLESRVRSILAYEPSRSTRLVTAAVILAGVAALPLLAIQPVAVAAVQERPKTVPIEKKSEASVVAKKHQIALNRPLARNRPENKRAELKAKEGAAELGRKRRQEDLARFRESLQPRIDTVIEDLEELKLKLRDLDKRVTDKRLEGVLNNADFSPSHPIVVNQERILKTLLQMVDETKRQREELRAQLQELRAKQASIR